MIFPGALEEPETALVPIGFTKMLSGILLVQGHVDKCHNCAMTEPRPDDEELQPSKTRRKREAEARQQLGAALLKLSKAAFAQIPLPEKLADALEEARRIRQHGALKRQLQYIGKLMREVDVEPIRAAYERVTHPLQEDVEQHHRLEQWRDRLLAEGDAALGELLALHPDIDRQHLRQLIRSAGKEAAANKPPRSARELFRYLREVMKNEPGTNDE